MEDLKHKLRPVVSSFTIIEHRTATLEDTFWTNLGCFRRDLGALISQMLIISIIIINFRFFRLMYAQTCSFKRISRTYTCTYSIFELCIYYNLCIQQLVLYSSPRTFDCIIRNYFAFQRLCIRNEYSKHIDI